MHDAPPVTQDHWVYLCYDADDRLLYVGVTSHGIRRFGRGHGKRADWWTLCMRIEVEHHLTREAALDRERSLIVERKPAHNIQHAPSVRRIVPERWLSIEEIADELSVGTSWVETKIKHGMPHAIIAGNVRFRMASVDAWLKGA